MDLKTIIIVILTASLAAYFLPTPTEMQAHFKSGQDFYASRDYRKAIDQFDMIINTESSFLRSDSVRVSLLNNEINVGVRTAAYYQKANALRNLGQKDSAVEYLRIVEKREDSPKLSALAQFQIYELFYADKKYDLAIHEARNLIAQHPYDEKVPRAYYDIGWAFREVTMIDSSNLAFTKLTGDFPDHELDVRARYQIAQNFYDQQRWDDAITTFQGLIDKYQPEKFAKADWENVELKAVRDRKMFEAQAGKDAETSGLELAAKSQIKIGDCHQKKGNFESAILTYRKVITTFGLMPTLVEVTYNKMAEYSATVKGSEAGIQVYRDAIDENFSNKPLQAKLQYKIAKTLQEAKLYDRAAGEYLFYCDAFAKQAVEIKFPVEQAMFLAVSNFYNARNYPKALATADTMIVNFPQSDYLPKIYMYKGLSLAATNKFVQARDHYRRVVELAPSSNEAILAEVQLGKSYFDERKYEDAIKAFEHLHTADQSKLDLSELHYMLGLCYYSIAQYDTSIHHLRQVESTSGYYPFTFARITRAFTAQQRYAEAEKYLTLAFAEAKRDTADYSPFVRLARSELRSAQQQYELAIADFDTIASNKSLNENTRTQAFYGRGLLLFELGKFKEAAADLDYCVKSPVFQQVFPALLPQAKEKLAYSYVNLEKKKEGLALINELLAGTTTEVEKSKYLAMACEYHYRGGDYQKAIELAKQILSMKEKDENSTIRTFVTMSNAYGNLQQHAKAIETLRAAGDMFPTNSYIEETFFQLGMIYFNGGDFASAAETFKSHMLRFPKTKFLEDVMYNYAFSLYQSGQADESVKSFGDFLKRFPESKRAAEAQVQIGEAYFNTNRFAEAAREYQIAYHTYPNNENAALAMFNEGWCYYQTQANDKMIATFRALVNRFPTTNQAADAQFAIGDYYYNQKTYDSALVGYTDFLRLFPNDPRAEESRQLIKELGQVEAFKEYEVAMAFFEAKNWKQAIVELTSVMSKFPESDVVFGCKANIASAFEQQGDRKRALQLFNEIVTEWKDRTDARPSVLFAELHKKWIEAGK